MKEYLTLKEISKTLKTPVNFFRKAIREQKLKAKKLGRQYIVEKNDLLAYLENIR